MESIDTTRLQERINAALREDIGAGDVTASSVVEYDPHVQAEIIARQDGVIAGIEVALLVFRSMEPSPDIMPNVRDGDRVKEGQQLLSLEGSGQAVLTAERTALNLLGRLSGIATFTRRFVDQVEGTGAKILDTRKTTPNWRDVEKYAVRTGGGKNHRMGLYDMVLIKENHVRWAGGFKEAIRNARQSMKEKGNGQLIEVEVRTIDELEEVLHLGVRRVMLDNMSPAQVRYAVKLANGECELEVSGGISLDTVRDFAETGVDYISVGSLTHSPPAFDLSLLVRDENRPPNEPGDSDTPE